VINPEQISAHGVKRMGLQIADAVASGFFFAVNQSAYGFVEDRYARMLKDVVYHNNGRWNGYGLKFWPKECEPQLKTESHYKWLLDDYSFG
jgi:hypothetical protein